MTEVVIVQQTRVDAVERSGAVRPDPLRELNQLLQLGSDVVDVRRWETAPRWGLVFAAEPTRYVPVNSRELRNPTSLNRHAWLWGRPFELPPLTKEDGCRVLRLMHEHVEEKEKVQ